MPSRQVLLLLLTGSVLLTACSNRLKTPEIESAIKTDIEQQGRRLTLKAVRCPNNISRQTNASFRCVGEIKPEGTFTINVVQVDNRGTVEWDVPNSKVMLNLVKVENQIQDDLAKVINKRARIDCGNDIYRANQAGDRFECQVVGGVTVGLERIETVVVSTAPEGNLTWQEMRQPMQSVASSANLASFNLRGISSVEAVPPVSSDLSRSAEPKGGQSDAPGSSD